MSELEDIQKAAREAINKRRYERFRSTLQIRYHLVGGTEKNTLMKTGGYAVAGAFMAKAAETQDLRQVFSEDLSLGGLRISSPEPIKPGTDLWINVKLPAVPMPINALATVVRSGPVPNSAMFSSGLKFNAINQADVEKVERFLALQSK